VDNSRNKCRLNEDPKTLTVTAGEYDAVVTGTLKNQIALSQVDRSVSSKLTFDVEV